MSTSFGSVWQINEEKTKFIACTYFLAMCLNNYGRMFGPLFLHKLRFDLFFCLKLSSNFLNQYFLILLYFDIHICIFFQLILLNTTYHWITQYFNTDVLSINCFRFYILGFNFIWRSIALSFFSVFFNFLGTTGTIIFIRLVFSSVGFSIVVVLSVAQKLKLLILS